MKRAMRENHTHEFHFDTESTVSLYLTLRKGGGLPKILGHGSSECTCPIIRASRSLDKSLEYTRSKTVEGIAKAVQRVIQPMVAEFKFVSQIDLKFARFLLFFFLTAISVRFSPCPYRIHFHLLRKLWILLLIATTK